ncbi:MAG: hypothetical protein AB1330_01735 [Bacillota bacterium]
MGLDTYAAIGDYGEIRLAPEEAFADVPGVLVGGMFSGHGNGPSFRGKVYDRYVYKVTGESLYQECIPSKAVSAMAVKLEKAAAELNDDCLEELHVTRQEAHALAAWFRVCADNRYVVCGWW